MKIEGIHAISALDGLNQPPPAVFRVKNCGNYVQVKVKISEFSPLLLLSLVGT